MLDEVKVVEGGHRVIFWCHECKVDTQVLHHNDTWKTEHRVLDRTPKEGERAVSVVNTLVRLSLCRERRTRSDP
jgi:hypothetical protein